MASGAFEVKGTKELSKAFDEISKKIRNKVVRGANYAASSVPIHAIRDEITQMGLVKTGVMRDRIASKVLYRSNKNQFVLIVGPKQYTAKQKETARNKKRKPKILRDPYYTRFLEFGTEHIKARHFMQIAFHASSQRFAARYITETKSILDNELRNLKINRK